MAPQVPWLTLNVSNTSATVTEYASVLDNLNLSPDSYPLFTAMIGKKTKSDLLQTLADNVTKCALPRLHSQAYLHTDRSIKTDAPTIYVDYELQSWDVAQPYDFTGGTIPQRHAIDLLAQSDQQWPRRKVGNTLCGQSIAPLCDALCYFAMDLGGLKPVAASLAEHILHTPSTEIPLSAMPRVLVVVETAARSFDAHATEARILEMTEEIWRRSSPHPHENFTTMLRSHYFDVRVIGLGKRNKSTQKCVQLRKRLLCIKREVHLARTVAGLRFKRDHMFSFASKLVSSIRPPHHAPFSFVENSRPAGLDLTNLSLHIKELVRMIPSEIWLCHLVVPLLSSSLILATYPPDSHLFPISMVFDQLYQNPCQIAIDHLIVQQDGRDSFSRNLRERLHLDFEQFKSCTEINPATQHLQRLQDIQSYLLPLKSHKTCLCCLLRTPEKVFSCGHTLCDTCVRSLGETNSEERNTFKFNECVLCGRSNHRPAISLAPCTAGIRILSLDGGGVKGVITLGILQHLEDSLSELCLPIRDVFDFVCGTSAGGLIAIGLFVMGWSTSESLEKFEDLAYKTFQSSQSSFGRIRQLVTSYLRDGKYSSVSIEESFKSTFKEDEEINLFNPLNNDTKIAITTTTAKESAACIFSNYNGGHRPKELGYSLIRAEQPENDISVSEAACCTSAAPWFFKPRLLKHLGTFQDGGLHYNNPLNIARWESKYTWPGKSIDFALSIGTGTTDEEYAFNAGVHSPVKDRFVSRLCKTFMRSLDGERIWREIYNSLNEQEKRRYHRLNMPIQGKEPMLDDTLAISTLKEQAHNLIRSNQRFLQRFLLTLDAVYASMFYFELDCHPVHTGDSYACTGHVYCRSNLPIKGRRELYTRLRATSSYFLVMGDPTCCVEDIPVVSAVPPFQKQLRFTLETLEDAIGITLTGITSLPTTISGLPKTAAQMIQAQQLQTPFGRVDCSQREKPLPPTPF